MNTTRCTLCSRPLLNKGVRHHLKPHSLNRFNRHNRLVKLHPLCHLAIHTFLDNHALNTHYNSLSTLYRHKKIRRYLKWIAKKPDLFLQKDSGITFPEWIFKDKNNLTQKLSIVEIFKNSNRNSN